jgi:hypothetical protein
MFKTGMFSISGNASKELGRKILSIYNLESKKKSKEQGVLDDFFELFEATIKQRRFPRTLFALVHMRSIYIAITTGDILVCMVDSTGESGQNVNIQDFRDKNVTIKEFVGSIATQIPFTKCYPFTLPISFVDLPPTTRKVELQKIVDHSINKEIRLIMQKTKKIMIPEKKIKYFLDNASEDEFIEILLIPLLREMGFKKCRAKGHIDKTLEYGQDIRTMKLQIPTEHYLYFTAQVKAVTINYGVSEPSANIESIYTEISMALDKEMIDFDLNISVLPDHGILISSKRINEGARSYLAEKLKREKRRRILFLEQDDIIEKCLRLGLPELTQKSINEYGDA